MSASSAGVTSAADLKASSVIDAADDATADDEKRTMRNAFMAVDNVYQHQGSHTTVLT